LVECGADVNGHHKEDGWTSLHLVSRNGHLDTAKLLIDHGANVDSQNDKQQTPLAAASWFGHLEVVRLLIESGVAVSARDREGHTPFHMASDQGHLHVTKFLLECGIDVDIWSRNEQTPLCNHAVKFCMGSGKEASELHMQRGYRCCMVHIERPKCSL
jgi:ankyrin repeat protein